MMPEIVNRDAPEKELPGWSEIRRFCVAEFSAAHLPHQGHKDIHDQWQVSTAGIEQQYKVMGLPVTIKDGEPVTTTKALYDWYENLPVMTVGEVQKLLTLIKGLEPPLSRVKRWIAEGIGEHEGQVAKHNLIAWLNRSPAFMEWATGEIRNCLEERITA